MLGSTQVHFPARMIKPPEETSGASCVDASPLLPQLGKVHICLLNSLLHPVSQVTALQGAFCLI